jgi:hypothetical protein
MFCGACAALTRVEMLASWLRKELQRGGQCVSLWNSCVFLRFKIGKIFVEINTGVAEASRVPKRH